MKFEELEAMWAAQQFANPYAVDLAQLKRFIIPELKRRSRILGYEIFVLSFGLLVTPLLSFVNYLYAPPRNVTGHWVNMLLWEAVFLVLLLYAVRRVRRHLALHRCSTDTLRALTVVSLENIEAEMNDYLTAWWMSPVLIGLLLLTVYLNFPVTEYGWKPFALRAGLILGLPLLMSLVFWRHYRVNLKPAQARQKEILQQLS